MRLFSKNRMILAMVLVVLFATLTFAAVRKVTATLTAENTYTDWIDLDDGTRRHDPGFGRLNVSISGTWAGTLTLQRRFADDTTARDVETYTANYEDAILDMEPGIDYRIGFKTGDFSSGTATVRLSKQGR